MFPVLAVAAIGWLVSAVTGQSFKIETMGMIIHNSTGKTTIDHQRPITNVRGVVFAYDRRKAATSSSPSSRQTSAAQSK